jgi:tRNA dimethylallyltransferase
MTLQDPIRLIVIAGPTGVGKSETAVRVAEDLSGEVVSADSVQLYRHFDIGSGKPSPDFRKRVPHHLIDFIAPDIPFSLWDFREEAQKIIADIADRGKVPILTGGTGLYIKAVLENLKGGVAADPEMRRSLLGTLKEEGPDAMYQWLIRLDSRKAAGIHPNDTHRIIRGIENAILPQPDRKVDATHCYKTDFFILNGPREKVYERIDKRVTIMLSRGWIDETKNALALGFGKGCKPFQSVGYRQIVEYLDEELPMERLTAEIQRETRRYAKRQITWLNPTKNGIWLDSVTQENGPEKNAPFIAEYFTGRGK